MQDVPTKATGKPFKWVGTRPVRPDGVPKVTGRALYGADLTMPGMLVGRILRSPHAHARIRSIDTAKAAALPGVKAVVTSADFPAKPNIEAERPSSVRSVTTRNSKPVKSLVRRLDCPNRSAGRRRSG
jgi:CO/xanthine dehydrogenase Mo-binding subunit